MIGALLTYLPALLATLALELPIVAVAFRGRDRRRALQIAIAVNLLTHPLVTLAAWHLEVEHAWLEAAVIVVEALAYDLLLPTRPWRALLVSLLANATSWIGGFLLMALLA